MVARVKDLASMPAWPRMLSRDQAAAYLGVSPGTFLREVAHGKWPLPMERGSRKTWDRVALDRVLDQSAGLVIGQPGQPGNPGDEEDTWADVV